MGSIPGLKIKMPHVKRPKIKKIIILKNSRFFPFTRGHDCSPLYEEMGDHPETELKSLSFIHSFIHSNVLSGWYVIDNVLGKMAMIVLSLWLK